MSRHNTSVHANAISAETAVSAGYIVISANYQSCSITEVN
jgi:hypothetical protein